MKSKTVKRGYIFGLLLLLGLKPVFGQVERFQAAYIYNITRYIEWPDEYKSGNFIIGVIGNNAQVLKELNVIASAKKVVNRSIEVQSYANPASIGKCNILFIPSGESKHLGAATAAIGNNATLIVTDDKNALNNGAAINFVMLDNKLRFEIKKSNIENRGMKMSSSLTQLASKTY